MIVTLTKSLGKVRWMCGHCQQRRRKTVPSWWSDHSSVTEISAN